MIKTYRKTTTIQAEQFEGLLRQRVDYRIKYDRLASHSDNAPRDVMPTLEGDMGLQLGDWIATGVKGEHWSIVDDVFKASYVEVAE